MELVYFWIAKDYDAPQNGVGYKFTGEFLFQLDISERKDSNIKVELSVEKNAKHIDNFFASDLVLISGGGRAETPVAQVKSVTGIIGKNGVGKTTLIHDVIDLLTNQLILRETYFAIYKENDKLKLIHSDDLDLSTNNKTGTTLDIINEDIDDTYDGVALFRTNKILFTKDQIIYYNPALDFRNIPVQMSRSGKKYIDISTNALIMDDDVEPGLSHKNHDQGDNELNPVINHKIASIRRSIDLTYSNLSGIDKLNIPQEYKVSYQEYYFSEEGDQKNVEYDTLQILENLREKINKVEIDTSSVISAALKSLNRADLPTDSEEYIIADEEFQKAAKRKVLANFINSLTNTFFDNLHDEYMHNLDVKHADLESNDLFEYAHAFFSKQNFAQHLDSLLDSIRNCINRTTYNDQDELDYFTLTDPTQTLILLSNYQSYLNSYAKRNSRVRTCLNFDWRDISTGEKMKLDLYGRLLFASRNISNETKNVLIFIDEGELGFHPEWKKKYLDDLLTFISECFIGKSIQLVLTTHSPFLISDLPSANLILLDKDEEGVVKSLETEGVELFAANIYDLYRNSFFMEDGTYIGKFARRKIDEILDYIHEGIYDTEAQEKYKMITNLIGDKVIKTKLLELMSTKTPPQDDVDSQLEGLRKQREKLDIIIKKMEDDLGESK